MPQRKGVKSHLDAKVDAQLIANGDRFNKAKAELELAMAERNKVWFMAYHTYGYSQTMIKERHNAKLTEGQPGHITNRAVEKVMERA